MPAPARSTQQLKQLAADLPATALRPMHRFAVPDAPRILAHLLGLDAEDRMLRFSHGIRDEGIAAYVSTLDFASDHIHGLCTAQGAVIALAHAGVRDGALDFGLSVSPDYRMRGLGRALFGHVITLACTLPASRIICHSISPAVLHMAAATGFRRPGGILDAPLTLDLPANGRPLAAVAAQPQRRTAA